MQNDYELENQRGIDFRLDANGALQSLVSFSSGDYEPPVVYANMPWADTGKGILWRRNTKNTEWLFQCYLEPGNSETLSIKSLSATGNATVNGTLTAPSIRSSANATAISVDKLWHSGNLDPGNLSTSYNASAAGHGWDNWMGYAGGQRLYFTANSAAYSVWRATASGVIDAAAMQIMSPAGGGESVAGLNVRDNNGRSINFLFSSGNGGGISTSGGMIRPNTVNYVNGVGPDNGGNVNVSVSVGSASLGRSGWQKLPSGLIIQWGSCGIGSYGANGVNLPINFPSVFASVAIAGNGRAAYKVSSELNGTTSIIFYNSDESYSDVRWIAIGY